MRRSLRRSCHRIEGAGRRVAAAGRRAAGIGRVGKHDAHRSSGGDVIRFLGRRRGARAPAPRGTGGKKTREHERHWRANGGRSAHTSVGQAAAARQSRSGRGQRAGRCKAVSSSRAQGRIPAGEVRASAALAAAASNQV